MGNALSLTEMCLIKMKQVIKSECYLTVLHAKVYGALLVNIHLYT